MQKFLDFLIFKVSVCATHYLRHTLKTLSLLIPSSDLPGVLHFLIADLATLAEAGDSALHHRVLLTAQRE